MAQHQLLSQSAPFCSRWAKISNKYISTKEVQVQKFPLARVCGDPTASLDKPEDFVKEYLGLESSLETSRNPTITSDLLCARVRPATKCFILHYKFGQE